MNERIAEVALSPKLLRVWGGDSAPNEFGGLDYFPGYVRRYRVRLYEDDTTIRLAVLSENGVLQYAAEFSDGTPISLIAAATHEALRSAREE